MNTTEKLRKEVARLQASKLALVQNTSAEIQRLRTIIRILTGTDTPESLAQLNATPPPIDEDVLLEQIHKLYPRNEEESRPNRRSSPRSGKPTKGGNQTTPGDGNGDFFDTTLGIRDSLNVDDEFSSSLFDDIKTPDLISIPEHDLPEDDENESATAKRKKYKDAFFKLDSTRMSQMGYNFADVQNQEAGFMTTDFDQLIRGHQSWVNDVFHHPVQNGVVVSASDDWSIMFWRFWRLTSRAERKERTNNAHTNMTGANQTQAAHTGEVQLSPILKINTGLEVKAIAISRDGTVLAATCFDDEEGEGSPALQLYFDQERCWTFKHDVKKDEEAPRSIRRSSIPLNFEPVHRALEFTRDGKFAFVALNTTSDEHESGVDADSDDDEIEIAYLKKNLVRQFEDDQKGVDIERKPPPSLICVDISTRKTRKCTRINALLADDEYVTCLSISPTGMRIAVGTSAGRLIVAGVAPMVERVIDDDTIHPMLLKLWTARNDDEGSVTAVCWSDDANWLIAGYEHGDLHFWRKEREPRVSLAVNKALGKWYKRTKKARKYKLFTNPWRIERRHEEEINSLSIQGSLLVTGGADGRVIVWDLAAMLAGKPIALSTQREAKLLDTSPLELTTIETLHDGRMVNAVALSDNYTEADFIMPSAGLFLVSSGGDHTVHCISMMAVMRDSLRRQFIASPQKIPSLNKVKSTDVTTNTAPTSNPLAAEPLPESTALQSDNSMNNYMLSSVDEPL